jgi:hypothetical protein
LDNHTDSLILDWRRGEENTILDRVIGLAEAPETDRDAIKENVLDAHVGDLCGIWRMLALARRLGLTTANIHLSGVSID